MADFNLANVHSTHWVATDSQLKQLCEKWSSLAMIAVDTEFMRTSTYYPKPALIQINDGEANYLIDPLAVADISPMTELMLNARVQKVLHSCSEDLEVFNKLLNCLPVNLFDTQIAAAFCGYGYSIGYAGLVEALMGVEVPKGETRSNWLQRPLTDSQKKYAALDVEYLFHVAGLLKQKLQSSKKDLWVQEECLSVIANYHEAQLPENGMQRFKSAWKLSEQSLAVLQALNLWREKVAQERDLPRNFVVKEKALYQIAETMPLHIKQLKGIEEFSEKSAQRYGGVILEIVLSVKKKDESQLPDKMAKPLTSTQKALVKKMRDTIQSIADSWNMAPEYLARKKDYEHIARSVSAGVKGRQIFPETLLGWRDELIQERLLALL